jgi:hypothetical protein
MANDTYRNQHQRILELITELSKELGPKTAANAAAINSILGKLGGALAAHLAAEDNVLYPKLGADPRPQVRNIAKQFQAEMGGLKRAFSEYSYRWNAASIATKSADFEQETRGIIKALKDRITREERDFYPVAGV